MGIPRHIIATVAAGLLGIGFASSASAQSRPGDLQRKTMEMVRQQEAARQREMARQQELARRREADRAKEAARQRELLRQQELAKARDAANRATQIKPPVGIPPKSGTELGKAPGTYPNSGVLTRNSDPLDQNGGKGMNGREHPVGKQDTNGRSGQPGHFGPKTGTRDTAKQPGMQSPVGGASKTKTAPTKPVNKRPAATLVRVGGQLRMVDPLTGKVVGQGPGQTANKPGATTLKRDANGKLQLMQSSPIAGSGIDPNASLPPDPMGTGVDNDPVDRAIKIANAQQELMERRAKLVQEINAANATAAADMQERMVRLNLEIAEKRMEMEKARREQALEEARQHKEALEEEKARKAEKADKADKDIGEVEIPDVEAPAKMKRPKVKSDDKVRELDDDEDLPVEKPSPAKKAKKAKKAKE